MSWSNGYNNGVMARLMKDIRNLTRKPLEDIEIRLDDSIYGGCNNNNNNNNNSNNLLNDSLKSLDAIILGPKDTPYENGTFLVRLEFGNDFPNSPPKGYFLTKIFHPNVKPNNGEICVNTLKKDWKPKYGIKHILIAIRSLLIVPNHDSALNQEAGKLLLESYDEFANRARMYTKIHAMNDMRRRRQSDDSSELDTTNENEERSNKPHSKSKLKTKSDSDNNNSNNNSDNSSNSDSNSNSNSNSNNDIMDTECKDSNNDMTDDSMNGNNSTNNNNNNNNNNQNDSNSSNNSNSNKSNNKSKSKSKGNKIKSKDKHKKKLRKGKSKGHLTKSMMRL